MLNIDSLIWVIPGMVGLRAYHKELSVKLPQPEGWVYLLSVVFFAFPYYVLKLLIPEWPIDWVLLLIQVFILIVSIPLCERFGRLVASLINKAQEKQTKDPKEKQTIDPFHNNCTLWRERLVFITLDSKRIYLGTLIDHTKDTRFEYTIKIIPVCSGYRNNNGQVTWDFKYPLEEEKEEDSEVEIIIPRSKITTLALWSKSKKFENAPI